ncbi:hypothetical protein [Citrobacter sp. R56]|uniref:hypothetical protein n=1 Tax=Citrobacter sp. R56 TaxID=1573676 RepID=UPI00193C714B|nr:hypothetical protein [Citrobacter sp. R56]QRG79576.1 hypothetical protein JM656_02245 [Citrobacter sp. R56]
MMLKKIGLFSLALLSASFASAEDHALNATELSRFPIEVARQGVAVDASYIYAIDDKTIAKYPKKGSSNPLSVWHGKEGDNIKHFNSCYAQDNVLYCSHSNYSSRPVLSSMEMFSTNDMSHVGNHSFGFMGFNYGSVTWVFPYRGYWWAGFANYDEKGTEAGKDHNYTALVKFDNEGRVLESWAFPSNVLEKMAPKSSSGGGWGPDGLLYVTGHDAKELYVLRLPETGSILEYVTTINVPFEGQAWAWDRSSPERIIYGITRNSKEVIVSKIPSIPAELLKPQKLVKSVDAMK